MDSEIVKQILAGFTGFGLGNAVMILAGIILIYLAIAKEYEPNLLIPIGIGCILANIGMAVSLNSQGAVTCSLDQNFLTIL